MKANEGYLLSVPNPGTTVIIPLMAGAGGFIRLLDVVS